MLSEFLKKA